LTVDASLDGTAFEGVTADSWDYLDLDQQRALVSLFVEHVIIRKGKRGRYSDPSRVQPVPVETASHEATTRPEPQSLATFDGPPWRGPNRALRSGHIPA
jgi:hypothetical protein